MTTDLVGLHYRLCAYVCGRGCIKPSPFEGWVTFTQILQQRPDGCRFAVAQMVPMVRDEDGTARFTGVPQGPFVVWDLHDEELVRGKRTGPNGLVMPPPPLWMGESEDGMVMRAVLSYDDAGN